MSSLAAQEIIQMFRDFGLETDQDRQRFLAIGSNEASEPPTQVFIRAESTTDSSEAENAQLA